MKVSIIIPVYNVGEFVSDCIDSVIQQTYNDLEIIVVNDGSTDNSGEICYKKSLEDTRVVYLQKENGGLSSARNLGLRKATGELIYFLDSDDYLVINAIQILVDEVKETSADIVSSDFLMIDETQKYERKIEVADFVQGDNTLFFCQTITNQACAKLYKKELFDDIFYPEGLHYEDVATTFKLYDKANLVSHTKCGLYCYRIRNGAITCSISKRDMNDLWIAYNLIKQYFESPSKVHLYYETTILYMIYSRLLRSNCTNIEVKEYEKMIYREVESINSDIHTFCGKSPMYLKILLFKMRLIKYIIKIADLKKRLT